MIAVHCPPTYPAEREYILRVLFGEFLGLPWRLVSEERADTLLTVDGDSSRSQLLLADVLFKTPTRDWLTAGALPRQPLARWPLPDELSAEVNLPAELPVLFGKELEPGGYLLLEGRSAQLGLDVLGSAFFMLTRYEELVVSERDEHGRFAARSSLAYQEEFIGRPLVNEYVEVLWALLRRLWPGLRRRTFSFKVWPTHDVDAPFGIVGRSLGHVLRNLAGDVVARGDLALAARRLRSLMRVWGGDPDADINNTFELLMERSERRGLRSSFNMLAAERSPPLRHPAVKRLMQRIHARGHDLGLHPALGTSRAPARIKEAADTLRGVMAELDIVQDALGGRQHYLQWDCPATWQAYADAGLAYDSSVCFADHAGFRAGTCYEYPVFNLLTKESLSLRERPLVVMDTSLLRYQRLSRASAAELIEALKQQCRLYGGVFTVLWHNTTMLRPAHVELYELALSA